VLAATVLSLDTGLTGWTLAGAVTSTNATVHLNINGIPYDISPSVGTYMAQLSPNGVANAPGSVATAIGVNLSQITDLHDPSLLGNTNPTNFAYMSKSLTLQAGTTYKFYWAYASNDYTPFADGAFYSISNGSSVKSFNVLARTAATVSPITTGTAAYPAGVKILSSFGSTAWFAQTFTVSANGTYTLSFGDFNAGDASVDPVMFVSDLQGTIIGQIATLQGPSADNTQVSLEQSSSVLRGVYSLQNVSMNNNLSNDCTLFDKHGLCASLSGTQTNIAGGAFEGSNGTLTVAYRVNNNLRVGAYLDQTLNVNETTGVHLNNGSPGFGGFGVWNEHVDGYGAQVRVAAGYDDKDMTVTRQVIESSEAGTGKTNLTSYGASIVASYAMWMPGDITFSPYAGIRHTKVKAGAYTEATTDVVTAPLTYSALTQNVTTALVGAKWTTRITDKAIAYASLGVEQDLKNNGGTYTATGVDGLTSIAFNPDINRTRRTASIGSYYNLGDRQRIGANLAWSEQAFTSIDATSLMVTYTAGF
jgi:hypothetical protein